MLLGVESSHARNQINDFAGLSPLSPSNVKALSKNKTRQNWAESKSTHCGSLKTNQTDQDQADLKNNGGTP